MHKDECKDSAGSGRRCRKEKDVFKKKCFKSDNDAGI